MIQCQRWWSIRCRLSGNKIYISPNMRFFDLWKPQGFGKVQCPCWPEIPSFDLQLHKALQDMTHSNQIIFHAISSINWIFKLFPRKGCNLGFVLAFSNHSVIWHRVHILESWGLRSRTLRFKESAIFDLSLLMFQGSYFRSNALHAFIHILSLWWLEICLDELHVTLLELTLNLVLITRPFNLTPQKIL